MVSDLKLTMLKADKQALLDALRLCGANVSNPKAIRCPFHDDRHASAGVYESRGIWRFKCHAACCNVNMDLLDVRERATGQTVEDQLREMSEPKEPQRPERTFDSVEAITNSLNGITSVFKYCAPGSRVVQMVVFRLESNDGKRFLQGHERGDGRFVLKAPPKPWPIYNRTRIAQSDNVIVVEGEKCVHALHDVGYVGTTSPGGAGNAAHADWTPLAGKTVVLWPDNDAAGLAHMREVAGILQKLSPAPSLYYIDPQTIQVGAKEDVADVLARHSTREAKETALLSCLDQGVSLGASGSVRHLFENTISGRRVAQKFPFRVLTGATQALLPGTITVVCGDAGACKSMMVVQSIAQWQKDGTRFECYMLEDDVEFHLVRILAQEEGNSDLTQTQWIASHPEESRSALARHGAFLDAIGKHIHTQPFSTPDYEQMSAWVKAACSAGARIIVIDPVTAIDAGKEPWNADRKFVNEMKITLAAHGASMLCVTHPRGGKSTGNHLNDMAGGQAWARFTHTVLWMQKCKDDTQVRIKTSGGIDDVVEPSHMISISKARNGRWAGRKIAMQFDPRTLRFHEYGLVDG